MSSDLRRLMSQRQIARDELTARKFLASRAGNPMVFIKPKYGTEKLMSDYNRPNLPENKFLMRYLAKREPGMLAR